MVTSTECGNVLSEISESMNMRLVGKPLEGEDYPLHSKVHRARDGSDNPKLPPASPKAAIAKSTSASLSAADICVRMRALPFGTTGKKKPAT